MKIEDAAAVLNGMDTSLPENSELFAQMKAAGLVAVFGASDDLMEFRGAINDEVGAWGGVSVHVGPTGLIEAPDCDCDAAEELFELKKKEAKAVEAVWSDDGLPAWTYETKIPHVTFQQIEDGEVWCVGIVFDLANLELKASIKLEAGGVVTLNEKPIVGKWSFGDGHLVYFQDDGVLCTDEMTHAKLVALLAEMYA